MNKKELLFGLLRTVTFEQSGDGVSLVVSKQYKELANDFWEWENKLPDAYFTVKSTFENHADIVFSPFDEENSQEAVIFSCDVGIRSLESYDLVIFAETF